MEDEEFVKSYGMIINYFKPKLASTSIDANVNSVPKIEFLNVSKDSDGS